MEALKRTREDQYFLEEEQRRLDQLRRKAARDAETHRLMQAVGITDRELVRELEEAGFDLDTLRVLDLVPLVQVAWSDGAVSERESQQVFNIARLRGIHPGSAAHTRLQAWLTERPSDGFFQTCLRGIKAMLHHRPGTEAQALSRDLAWYCTRVAEASGGIFGLGPKVSREEAELLAQLTAELDSRHHDAADRMARELSR